MGQTGSALALEVNAVDGADTTEEIGAGLPEWAGAGVASRAEPGTESAVVPGAVEEALGAMMLTCWCARGATVLLATALGTVFTPVDVTGDLEVCWLFSDYFKYVRNS